MLWGLLGLFVGANLGIVIMGLLVAAKSGDNPEARYARMNDATWIAECASEGSVKDFKWRVRP